MPLYHFSDDPSIAHFVPRPTATAPQGAPVVWAIDDAHAPMYYFPRDCPRACFWPGPATPETDRARWFGGVDARMVIVMESGWLARLRTATLYRYHMPEATFHPARADDPSGRWVSRQPVTPVAVESVGDLLAALVAAEVELRITPRLLDLWRDVIQSTLEFSGTRLRNAVGWRFEDWVPAGEQVRSTP